jgi:predicted nucleic acid-binding protein
MRLVVDASVALKWFVEEAGSDLAEHVAMQHELIAPELIVAEVHNALWRIERLGRLGAEDVAEATASFPSYFDRLFALTPLEPLAARIARALDHPVYDCFYVALAEIDGSAMVTADRRFLERLAGSPWAARVVGLEALTSNEGSG